MKNQFFYSFSVLVEDTENPGQEKEIIKKGSFNLEKVVRTLEDHNDNLIVVLDDFHEEIVTNPTSINPNTNRVIKNKKEKGVVHSEIILGKEDKERFIKLTNIE